MTDAFNLLALRRLYNPENSGKGTEGLETRARLHTTVTYKTFIALTKVVPVKKGGYGAPVVELAVRVILAAIGSLSIETVGEELFHAVLPVRSVVIDNLRKLADVIENYKVD